MPNLAQTVAIKEALKSAYGYYDAFYELSDSMVAYALMETIKDLSIDNDPCETPDNKAHTLSSFYRVLSYYLTPTEYKAFLKEMSNN